MKYNAWMLEHFTLFRLALFFCCFAYWLIGYYWFKPQGRELPAAIMAAWMQFSLGTLADTVIVEMGYWVYRPMPFSLHGVPLDLHLDWALIWGFFLVWCYSRLRRFRKGLGFALLYLAAWTLWTLAFDAAMASHLLFLSHASTCWWCADTLFLFIVQGVTLWVYHGILYPPALRVLAVWNCRLRSVFYVLSLAYVFYDYLPGVVLSLTGGWDAHPLFGLDHLAMLVVALILPFALGAWATVTLADEGLGTPLPLDPPCRLVTTGPYAYVRNPMQIAGILCAVTLLCYHPTLFILVYVLDMILVSVVLFHFFERGELARAFGEDYLRYQGLVHNWLPCRNPYS